MPTPFQHLHYAQQVLRAPSLPAWLVDRLRAKYGAFLLGNTAGDVQAITGQSRLETHFYSLSDLQDGPAGERLLSAFPALSDPSLLSPAHAVFVSGYLVHLVWDQIWAKDVFIPLYQDAETWQDRMSPFVHHNALRVCLDRDAYSGLDRTRLAELLAGTKPARWLPFVADAALVEWRDWLVEQLLDPDRVQTAAVFAERMGVPISVLEGIVGEMTCGTYAGVPGLTSVLAAYEAAGQSESAQTLLRYWDIEPKLELAASGTLPEAAHGVKGE